MYDNVFGTKWVSSGSALKLFGKAIRDKRRAKKLLSKGLVNGEIRARCEAKVDEFDFNVVPNRPGKSSKIHHRIVEKVDPNGVLALPQGFFMRTRKSLYQPVMWQFRRGIFAVGMGQPRAMTLNDDGTATVQVNRRWVGYGVTFKAKDLVRFFEYHHKLVKRPSLLKKSQPKKGRGRWNWAAAFNELEQHALENNLPTEFGSPEKVGFQKKIEVEISNKLMEIHGDHASPSAIRSRVVDFLKRHDFYRFR